LSGIALPVWKLPLDIKTLLNEPVFLGMGDPEKL